MIFYRMPEIHTGADAAPALERILNELDVRRLFIVTGPHVSRSAAFAGIMALAEKCDREVRVFDRTTADPTLELVEEMTAEARSFRADCVLGFGGGSPLDAAKIVAVLADRHDMTAAELVGTDLVPKRRIPLFMIPTTAGTASEVTIYSVLTDTVAKMKAPVCSSQIIPDYAFLIPEATYSMPPSVTAATGMDALCHAAEAHLSKRRNPFSDVMGLAAMKLISRNLRTAFHEPEHAGARENMLIASLFAGLAFGNASVTAVHAFAYPLGGMHHIPHGLANSLMFNPVFRHNMKGNEERYAALAEAFCGVADPNALIPAVNGMKRDLGLPMSLQEAGIPECDLESMSQNVMTVTRLLNLNPNVITLDDARRIYREAYNGD